MRELCLTNLSLVDADAPALIEAAASAGFASVTLWLATPSAFAERRRHIAPALGDPGALAAIRRRLADTGIRVFTVAGTALPVAFDGASLDPTLEAAAALGARAISVNDWNSERDGQVDVFASVCAAASDYGLDVHLEFIPSSSVRTITEATRLLDAADAPNGRLIVDAVHLSRSGGTPSDVARVDARLIGSIQLSDVPLIARYPVFEETLAGRLYPGEGELPLHALMRVLPVNVVVEVETPVARDAHLSFGERAGRCAETVARFLNTT